MDTITVCVERQSSRSNQDESMIETITMPSEEPPGRPKEARTPQGPGGVFTFGVSLDVPTVPAQSQPDPESGRPQSGGHRGAGAQPLSAREASKNGTWRETSGRNLHDQPARAPRISSKPISGVSEQAFEQIEAERMNRTVSKQRRGSKQTEVIAEELDYVELQQQKLKVNNWLDEDEKKDRSVQSVVPIDLTGDEEKPQEFVPIKHVNLKRDGLVALATGLLALSALILVCAWDAREPRHDVHHAKMNKYQAHITSPLYAVSSSEQIILAMDEKLPTEVLDLKMAVPCVGYCRGAGHRRLTADGAVTTGTAVAWQLLAGDRELQSGSITLSDGYEAETYVTLDPKDLGAESDDVLSVRVTTESEVPLGILCQVTQLGLLGRHRVPMSLVLFLLSFGLILSEVINRCYATFIGASAALFLVSITYGTPDVATVMGMVDFGTLILLASMMMCVHIFAVTGFFQWIAVRLAAFAKGDARMLFFLMSNAMGWLSCILPNVTCVMLIGPITISLCKQMDLDPVPFYLAQTICSTIGGTTTMIGDPPNLVIGAKLGLKFMDFIIYNGPIVFVILPMASWLLFMRFREKVCGTATVDIVKMKREHPIIDERQFVYTATVFAFITIGLFTSPIHGIRPAWFCLTGFFLMAMVNSHHQIKPYLNAVEWDTLLFFANLFIFVECLAELGLIKWIGEGLADTIKSVDVDSRLAVAVVLVLWVSTIGSAFLESLPYTTTMTYILLDIRNSGDMGIPVEPLSWALSVGACVGGIGSIMGSSANLVSMAVSERYSPDNPIKGNDFLKFGFPTLLVITCVVTVYQVILFAVIQPYT